MTGDKPSRFIKVKDVIALTSMTRTTIYERSKDPADSFPAPIRLSESRIAWDEAEVLAWRDTLPRVVEKSAA